MLQYYQVPQDLLLESGQVLSKPRIAYSLYGPAPQEAKSVFWVCHALTANSEVSDWWAGVFGPGKFLDPEKHCIICANVLGSCYGSTGPLSPSPSGQPYYGDFPLISPRDMAWAHELLRQHLGIERIALLIGSSLGGQQAMEWAISSPQCFEKLVLIATNVQHSPFGIAFNEAQRMAIRADQSYGQPSEQAGWAGLEAARAIAMLSYRGYAGYAQSQAQTNAPLDGFRAASYQNYQGQKLAKRFNAYSYVTLSKAMDAHHIGRGRGSLQEALARVQAQSLAISVSSDILFPPSEQEFLARHIPQCSYAQIHSDFGHDGFLVEFEQLETILFNFFEPASAPHSTN